MLRIVFLGLGGLSLTGWIAFYVWINAMACTFGNPNGGCRAKWPWELGGEDLMLLVVLPGCVTAILFALAWITGRNRR